MRFYFMTKDELLKEHPHYAAYKSEWLFYVRSYFGGKRYRDGDYLIKYPLESDENYKRRKAQAYFYNYCAPIIDIFVSLLFKATPVRKYGSLGGDALFQDFLSDADLEGNTFTQFIREANRYTSIYGRVSILIDKPSQSTITKAQAQEQGIRPYLTLIMPENIINWSFVRLPNGRPVLDGITVVEDRDKGGKPSRLRVWNRDVWALYQIDKETKGNEDITPTDMGIHGLNAVPLVNLYNKSAVTRMIGVSDIEDIAYINRNIFYLCSDAQEIVENTAFPMLALPFEKGGADETRPVGAKNILEFDPDAANSKPFWLEAPHSSLAEIRELVGQHEKTIYKIANLLGLRINPESVQPSSGIALEVENQQRNAVLAEKADNMEQAENQILSLYAKWEGREFDGTIDYPNDFSLTDKSKTTEQVFNALRDLDTMSMELRNGLEKKLTKQLLPDIEKAKRQIIYKDIEKRKIITTNSNGGMNNG